PALALPPALGDALTRTMRAFLAPVEGAQARLAELKLRQREGIGDLRDLSDAIAATEAEVEPFVERFQLVQGEMSGPAPLACAARRVQSAIAAAAGGPVDMPHANALLLLAAALDGH